MFTFFNLFFCLIVPCFCIDNPEEIVNWLAGSFTDGNHFSTGNTLPLITMPWGFNNWSPQTKDGNKHTGSWWFQGNEHKLTWLRCTHQPSPWIGDYGWFLFSPQISRNANRNPLHFWEPRGANIKPHIFDATVAPFNMRMELTPTIHGAIARFTFPSESSGIYDEAGDKRVCFVEGGWTDSGEGASWGSKTPFIQGVARQISVDRMAVTGFGMHILIEADYVDGMSVENHGEMRCFKYPRTDSDPSGSSVTIRMATSMISAQQAAVSLHRELPKTKTFDEIAAIAKSTWNKLLKRMDVKPPRGHDGLLHGEHDGVTTSKHLPVFYTSLARSLIFPRLLDETDESGQVIHWSPYAPPDAKGNAGRHPGAGAVYKGSLVTDNGFWDTFRTVYPLLSIAYPDALGIIIQGWLNAYKEGGWLPSWASPGYRNCMVGTYADVVIADAIVKGIKGFEYETAYQALKKDSFVPPPAHAGGAVGKEGLNTYVEHGYLPYDAAQGEIVSRALDFAHADWAVANAFRKLAGMTGVINSDGSTTVESEVFVGTPPEYIEQFRSRRAELLLHADQLEKRAHGVYHKLYDAQSGLMFPKDRRGNNGMHTRPTEWGKGYTEGNAWHHSFIPWAVDELSKMHNNGATDFKPIVYKHNNHLSDGGVGSLASALRGNSPVTHGKENGNGLLKTLHHMLTMTGNFQPGSYGREIHEMTEARALALGQYGHNNQPCHHILYMFAMLNDRYSTESYVRNVMERGYGIDFYAGDEDNGEMSAWYVLSAMGLYPLGLGGLTGEYVMGVPLFNHLHVTFPIASSSTTSSASSHQFYEHLMAPLSSEPMENLDILAIGSDVNHYHVKSILLNSNKVATFSSQWDIGDHPQRIPANIISHRDFMKTNSVLQFVIDADVENGKPCTILTHELLMKTEVENEYSHSLQDKNPHATPLLPPPDIGREHPVSDSLNAIILDLENKERQDKVDLTKQKQQEQDVALKEKQAQWEKEHQEHHEEAAQQQLELDTLTHTTETQAAIIKQLQLQLDSSRHEIHQHIAKSEVNSHSHGAAAVSLEDANKFADPIPDHDHDSVISKILHRIINTYPTYMILLIWCFGSLSILILVALSVSYIYVLFITKCCSKYVNASQLCHEQDTEQCDGSDSNSGLDGSNWCARSLTLFLKNLVGSKTQLMKKHEVYNV